MSPNILANTRLSQLGHQSDGATPLRLFLCLNLEEERLECGETPLWLWAGGKPVVGGSQVCGVGGGQPGAGPPHVVTSPLVPLRRLLLDFPPIEGCYSPNPFTYLRNRILT